MTNSAVRDNSCLFPRQGWETTFIQLTYHYFSLCSTTLLWLLPLLLPPKNTCLFKEILYGFTPQFLRSMLPSYFCILSMVGFGERRQKSVLVYHALRNQKSLCFSAEELSCFPLKSMWKTAGCRTFWSLKTSSLSLVKQGKVVLLLENVP